MKIIEMNTINMNTDSKSVFLTNTISILPDTVIIAILLKLFISLSKL